MRCSQCKSVRYFCEGERDLVQRPYGLDTESVSSQKGQQSSCTGVGGLVLLSMSPLLPLLRASRREGTFGHAHPIVFSQLEKPSLFLSLSSRSMGGGGWALWARAHPSEALNLLLPLSLPSSLTRPPPLPRQADLQRYTGLGGGENNTTNNNEMNNQ